MAGCCGYAAVPTPALAVQAAPTEISAQPNSAGHFAHISGCRVGAASDGNRCVANLIAVMQMAEQVLGLRG
jgi:hypothetical protein